jgi:hypothetical protein
MASDPQFTKDELEVLGRAAYASGFLVVGIDRRRLEVPKESVAILHGLRTKQYPGPGVSVIEMVRSRINSVETKKSLADPTAEDFPDRVLPMLTLAAEIVDAKCDPEVAAGYKDWIADIALRTARASKEAGDSHTGDVKISDKEQVILDRIDEALGR